MKNKCKILLCALIGLGTLSITSCGIIDFIKDVISEDGGTEVTKKVSPTGISIEETTIIGLNEVRQLSVAYEPSNCNTNKGVTWTSSDETIASITKDGIITGVALGGPVTVTATSTYNSEFVCSTQVTVQEIGVLSAKSQMTTTMVDYTDHNAYGTDCVPPTGNSKILVVPVWLTDSNKFITTTTAKQRIKNDIEKAFFGTAEDTGWQSVKTYYGIESDNQLNLTGVVTDWYECGYSISQVGSNDDNKTEDIVNEAVAWYKKQNSTKMTDFDTDSNGYIDGVILVYGAPDYSAASSLSSYKNLWAYVYWTVSETSNPSTKNPIANAFMWASYDFMYGDNKVTWYYSGDTDNVNIDTHTYIHEFGHMLGLNDYYDYSDTDCPAGVFSMQDFNIGGHDPYSLLSLGWIDPIVPTSTCQVTIEPFATSHDVILLTPEFTGSAFDEYILVELFTTAGLNELDTTYSYNGSYPKATKTPGLRVWHVDSRLTEWLPSSDSLSPSLTTTMKDGHYYLMDITNTTYLADDDNDSNAYASTVVANRNYKQLQLLQFDKGKTFNESGFTTADLWKQGSTFNMTTYSNQFYNKTKLNSGKNLGFSFSVSSLDANSATLVISKA